MSFCNPGTLHFIQILVLFLFIIELFCLFYIYFVFVLLHFQSLTILASIPAAVLILSLFFLLLYLLTRCCDRKSKKQRTFGCQKCTLIFLTILCCGAIGGGKESHAIFKMILCYNKRQFCCLFLGLYGNDDLHNGLVQVFNAGKRLNRLFINVRNQVNKQ